MDHLILGIVDRDEGTFEWRASLVNRHVFSIFLCENVHPIFGSVEFLIKHSGVFYVLFNTLLLAVKFHYQMMIDALSAVVAIQ